MTTIIDPELPALVAEGLRLDTPDILARYAAELGPPPGPADPDGELGRPDAAR